MKKINLLLLVLTAMVISSCKKEVIVYVEKPTETGTVRIIPSVVPPVENKTRAGHYDGTPTVDELKIYNYALFVFNSAGMLEASLIAMPGNEATGHNPIVYKMDGSVPLTFGKTVNGTANGLKVGTLLNEVLNDEGELTLSAGNKSFFAIVNAPARLLAVQDRYLENNTLNRQKLVEEELKFENLSSIVGAYDSRSYLGNDKGIVYFVNAVNNATDNRGFMMTTVGGTVERLLLEMDEDDPAEPIELTVGRAMAKVSLGSELDPTDYGTTSESQPNGPLDVLEYKIINNPTSMYIMPNISNGVLLTPYYHDHEVTSTSYLAKYFVSHNTSHGTGYIPVNKDGDKTFTYAIENANFTPKQGNATIAVIKGVFHPAGDNAEIRIFDNPEDWNSETLAKGETFYRIWVPEYEVQDQYGGTGVMAGKRYDGNYYTGPVTDENLAAYIVATPEWPDDIALEVVEYTGGECYYRLPLYNKGKNNDEAAPYTVKRNSYYKIDITSVEDAGYPDENGGPEEIDPDEPLEPQTHIEAKIIVDTWDEIDQSGAL